MGVILLAVAIVGALVPVPSRRGGREPAAPPAGSSAAQTVRTIALRYPPAAAPPRPRVTAGAHIVLQVGTSEAGQATVAALGLVAPAEPSTPARFDVLASRPGTYPIAFQPASGGAARTVGTLTVRGTR